MFGSSLYEAHKKALQSIHGINLLLITKIVQLGTSWDVCLFNEINRQTAEFLVNQFCFSNELQCWAK